MPAQETPRLSPATAARRDAILAEQQRQVHVRTDRLFAGLMLFQWVAGIAAALWISPLTWSGAWAETHLHVWAAVLLGGIITAFPVALAVLRPGQALTRHVIAVGQALSSALLIHLSGGRIETHFHVFGSLAFLAFYRDWRVLLTATVVVAADHLIRGLYWPQSVFGVLTASDWRWAEHAAWVAFEDLFLIPSCLWGVQEMRAGAARQAELEANNRRQTQLAELVRAMRGDPELETLGERALAELARQLGAEIGALYQGAEDDELALLASYGWPQDGGLPARFAAGEGIVGQVAREQGGRRLDLGEQAIEVPTGVGSLRLRHLLLAPLRHDQELEGLVAFGSLQPFPPEAQALLEAGAENMAVYLNAGKARRRTRELLAQTRAQALDLRRQNEAIEAQREALDAQNRALAEASRHKSEFLASMSHELRTPLNAIIGYTSLAHGSLKEHIDATQLQNLANAERAARTLLGLLNDVLDFSKIEAGRMELFLEEVALAEVVEEVMLTAEGLLLDKPVELKLELAPGLPPLHSDFVKLQQVLNNLVGNAIKATATGSVTVRARELPGLAALRLEVEDTGTGIPAEQLPSIFESFKQLDGSTRKRFAGTGLGLAITKRLCDLLGIEVGVQSEPGVGTLFWLQVPLRADASEAEPAAPRGGPGSGAPLPLDRLLLDYDPELSAGLWVLGGAGTTETLRRCLQGLPLRVEQVADTAELLARASGEPTWAAVLEPSGGEELRALQLLRQRPATRRLPLLLCAADPALDGLGPHRVEHLPKPVEPARLIETLARLTHEERGPVLLVEDDADARAVYTQVLEAAGIPARSVEDGEEALAWLEEGGRPRAIVLDLLMPRLDGFQVLARLQARSEWRPIPVVVATGKELGATERERLADGCQLLLEKGRLDVPGRLAEIVEAVARTASRTVLVVDDNAMNQDVAAKVLEGRGFRVLCADSGQRAIALAQEHLPDAVLMDLAMPGMDGFDTTRALRRGSSTAELVIIACTAFSVEEFRVRAREAGCDGFITKPIEPARLVDQIKRITLAAKVARLVRASGGVPTHG